MRRNVRMQHVRRGKRLEGRVAALPLRPETVDDALEALRRRRILQVRREQTRSVPRRSSAGPVTPAAANMAADRPLCAAQPECRNFVSVPSTQHSRTPAAKLPHVPAAYASACASSPSSFPAPYAMPNGENNPVGWKPRRWNWPGATTPTRQAISFEIAMARIASRPVTARVSDSASVAATDGLLMCTIDSLCVSSNSSACGNEALANAALVTPTRSPLPRMRHGPGGEIATAPARIARPNRVSAPASARPSTSRMRSFVVSTTSAGRSSYRTRVTHSASSLASVTFTLPGQSGAATTPAPRPAPGSRSSPAVLLRTIRSRR